MAIRKLALFFMVATSLSALTFGFRETITPEDTAAMRQYLLDNKDVGLGICSLVVVPGKGDETSVAELVAQTEEATKVKVQEIEAEAKRLDEGVEEKKPETTQNIEEQQKNEIVASKKIIQSEIADDLNPVEQMNLDLSQKVVNKSVVLDQPVDQQIEAGHEVEETDNNVQRRRILVAEDKDVQFAFVCVIDSSKEPIKKSGFGKFSEVIIKYLNKKNEQIKSYGTSQTTSIEATKTSYAILPYNLATGAELITAAETPNTITFKYTSILAVAAFLFAALF